MTEREVIELAEKWFNHLCDFEIRPAIDLIKKLYKEGYILVKSGK